MGLLRLVRNAVAIATWANQICTYFRTCRYLSLPQRINKGNYGWTASENVDFSNEADIAKQTNEQIPEIQNSSRSTANRTRELIAKVQAGTPVQKSFHVSDNWSRCDYSFDHIYDQATCGNCWAVSSASVMSDRICIGKTDSSFDNKFLSSDDVLRCCTTNGHKCGTCIGGFEPEAFLYWKNVGLVTGGDFRHSQSCKPSTFPPGCGSPCSVQVYMDTVKSEDLKCETKCTNDDYDVTHAADKHKGIYSPVMGKYLYHHVAKVVGWGESNGVEYWNVINIWGKPNWGDNGKFKLKIEEPDFDRKVPPAVVEAVLAGIV